MDQDHPNDADVDAERHKSGALFCTPAVLLDELVAIEVADLLFPSSRLRVASVAALLRRGGFPTAHKSAICRSTRSPNGCRLVTDGLFGGIP